MFQQGSILGSTFFASREPVRTPLSLRMVNACRSLASKDPSMAGSLAHRLMRGFLVTTDTAFPTVTEGAVVEVMDYDPVRKTSIVIGLKEPTVYVPHHWLALRTNPGMDVSMMLLKEVPPKGVDVFSSKMLHGSFEEAMEMAKALKASKKGCLFMPGRGLFVVAKDLDSLEATLEPVLGKGAKKRASGKGKAKGARKDRRGPKGKKGKAGPTKGPSSRRPRPRKQTKGKRKAHYKRGPTRRRSPRR